MMGATLIESTLNQKNYLSNKKVTFIKVTQYSNTFSGNHNTCNAQSAFTYLPKLVVMLQFKT